MPHCTKYFGWYFGKFLLGITSMLFIYFGYLKEKDYDCLCDMRKRDLMRRKACEKIDATAQKEGKKRNDANAVCPCQTMKNCNPQSVTVRKRRSSYCPWQEIVKESFGKIVENVGHLIKNQFIRSKSKHPCKKCKKLTEESSNGCCRKARKRKPRIRGRHCPVNRARHRRKRKHIRAADTPITVTTTSNDECNIETATTTTTTATTAAAAAAAASNLQQDNRCFESIEDIEADFQRTLMDLEMMDGFRSFERASSPKLTSTKIHQDYETDEGTGDTIRGQTDVIATSNSSNLLRTSESTRNIPVSLASFTDSLLSKYPSDTSTPVKCFTSRTFGIKGYNNGTNQSRMDADAYNESIRRQQMAHDKVKSLLTEKKDRFVNSRNAFHSLVYNRNGRKMHKYTAR